MWWGWKGQDVNILKGRAIWEMSKPLLTFIVFLHLLLLCCFTFFPCVYRKINKDHLTSSLFECTGKDFGYRNGRRINYSFLERQKKSGCSRIVRHCSHLENKPHSHGAWKSLNCFLSSCPHPLFLMGSPLMYNSVTIVAELVRRIEGKQVRPWPQRWVENFTCHTDILYYNDINYYCVDSVH